MGVGYGALEKAATGELVLGTALVLLVLKILATSVTIGSGGSGGVFAPSLFIGAMLGAAFGALAQHFFPGVTGPVGAYVLVGMAAVFASTSRAPITAVVILFELTRDYGIILPLMLAVVISTVVSQILYKESIYTKKIRRKGIEPPSDVPNDTLESVLVSDFMTRNFQSVPASTPMEALTGRFQESGQRGLVVLDQDGQLDGVVTVSDLERNLREGREGLTAGEIATHSLITAFPDQSLRETLMQLGAEECGRIPVVTRDNQKELVGVLRRHDIVRAYIQTSQRLSGQPEMPLA